MSAVVILSVVVPGVAGLLMLRSRRPDRASDVRGIALQTVIIILVLLAIAGTVAGVLASRGQTASEELKDQNVNIVKRFTDESACENAGFNWSNTNTHCYVPRSP